MPGGGPGGKLPEKIGLFTSGGQINSLKEKKRSQLISFECMFNAKILQNKIF